MANETYDRGSICTECHSKLIVTCLCNQLTGHKACKYVAPLRI